MYVASKSSRPCFCLSTFPGLLCRTADKFYATEDVDAAGQQHGKGAETHGPVSAGMASCAVPLVKVPALGLVVYVVKEAVLRNQEGV